MISLIYYHWLSEKKKKKLPSAGWSLRWCLMIEKGGMIWCYPRNCSSLTCSAGTRNVETWRNSPRQTKLNPNFRHRAPLLFEGNLTPSPIHFHPTPSLVSPALASQLLLEDTLEGWHFIGRPLLPQELHVPKLGKTHRARLCQKHAGIDRCCAATSITGIDQSTERFDRPVKHQHPAVLRNL